MSVEYRDNSVTVLIAEGIVSAAESWTDHVSSSIKTKSGDGWDGENGTENERGSGRENGGPGGDSMRGIKERFNDIFEIHMY